MILQRLVEFARRIPDLPPSMYSPLAFKWRISLDPNGGYLGITELSGGEKANRGLTIMSPNRKRSGTAPPPLLLADKASYVLGAGAESPADSWHFGEFTALTRRCAESTGEPAVRAVLAFLEKHKESPISLPEGLEPGDLVCFRVGDVQPTDLPAVRSFWVAQNVSSGDSRQCILCGRIGPVDRVSPIAVKGLARIGGQSSGMALVSANNDAFLSYGAQQALIAPTCRSCGEAYANSINYMLANEAYRVFVGPTAFLFWTSEESGFNYASLISQPQEEDVKNLIESYRTGQFSELRNAQAFYALSLSASAGRVVVRDWLETTVPKVQANLARWFQLQALRDSDGKPGRPFGVYALAASLYLKPNDQMVANVPRALVRCALFGGILPDWMLAQAVGRNRAEQGVTRNRAALIKAALLSQVKDYKEDYMEKLDSTCTSPGYLCGRLLAELEAAQKAAINPKATIVDRYYGAASSAPATVFGNLMRNNRAHMSTLNRDKPGIGIRIDKNLQEILSKLGEFPRTLTLKEQAMFALGYYHQKAQRWAKPGSEDNNTDDKEENQ